MSLLRWTRSAILSLSFSIAAAAAIAAPAVRSGTVPTPDGDLYYEMHGEGPPLVLIAGGPGAPRTSLMPEFERLTAQHTVIYFDNIGRGRSSPLPAGRHHSPWRDAEDVERLRLALKLERITLLGHSYGGFPALAYAARHGEHLDKLVISSSGHSAEAWQRNIDSVNLTVQNQYPEVWTKLMALRAQGVKSCSDAYQDLYGEAMGDVYWYDMANEARRKPYASGDPRDKPHREVYCDMIGDDPEWKVGGAMANFDVRPELARVRVPTFISVGRFDRVCMPRTAFEMRDAFPAGVAQVHVYEHSGHRPWVEEGDVFFRDLESFLDGKNGQTMAASPSPPTH